MFQSWCLCGRCGCFRARVVSMQTKRPTWLALMLCPKTALSTNCSNHSVTIPQNWAAHRWSSGAAGAETKQRHHHFSSNCQVVEQVVGFKQFRTELDSCSSFTQHSVDPVLIPSAAGGSTAPPAAEETQQGLSDWFIGHSLFLPSPSAVYPDVSSTIKHRAKRTRITNQAGKINDHPQIWTVQTPCDQDIHPDPWGPLSPHPPAVVIRQSPTSPENHQQIVLYSICNNHSGPPDTDAVVVSLLVVYQLSVMKFDPFVVIDFSRHDQQTWQRIWG